MDSYFYLFKIKYPDVSPEIATHNPIKFFEVKRKRNKKLKCTVWYLNVPHKLYSKTKKYCKKCTKFKIKKIFSYSLPLEQLYQMLPNMTRLPFDQILHEHKENPPKVVQTNRLPLIKAKLSCESVEADLSCETITKKNERPLVEEKSEKFLELKKQISEESSEDFIIRKNNS